jgi:hypothetical protein
MPLTYTIWLVVFWLIVFLFGHLIWLQVLESPRYSRVIASWYSISVSGFLITMTLVNLYYIHATFLAWIACVGVGLLIMACAFVMYMPFVFVVSSSLSIDTIIMMNYRGGTMPKQAVYDKFVSADAVEQRLRMMQTNGLLTPTNDRYFLTPKAIRVARFFTAMKHFWKLWPGG